MTRKERYMRLVDSYLIGSLVVTLIITIISLIFKSAIWFLIATSCYLINYFAIIIAAIVCISKTKEEKVLYDK